MSQPILIRCSKCGATNRVMPTALKPGRKAVCGRCKTPLAADAAPVNVTDATFAQEVEQSPIPVLLDLWAPWCGPCLAMAPALDQLAADMAGRVRVAKLNIDENPATASRFGVRSIPTLLILKSGREVDRVIGLQPKSELARRLEAVA
jgi:thioredoxin 2